ncbi:MAG TPA: hypothetical protein PLN86_16475 [Candidatus Hydrogenedentes bacterium]|jgi:hypothetical protein|nr:hypothetical protein [Candidatus Hydrogenedentota bacterium]
MNYTTLAKVKAALGAEENTDDTLLASKIDEASRTLDTTLCHAEADYFKAETVTNELVRAIITKDGAIICWPKKVVVTSVTKFEYRLTPRTPWIEVDITNVTISNNRQVTAWDVAGIRSVPVFVRMTYVGGYGTETWAGNPSVATISGLPADVIDAATVLAVRFYKEEKGGLTDSIGVAELGQLQYTKAIPTRVVEMTKPYKRIIV